MLRKKITIITHPRKASYISGYLGKNTVLISLGSCGLTAWAELREHWCCSSISLNACRKAKLCAMAGGWSCGKIPFNYSSWLGEWRPQDSKVFMGAQGPVASTALQNLPLLHHPSQSSSNQIFPMVQRCVSSVLAMYSPPAAGEGHEQRRLLERSTFEKDHGTDWGLGRSWIWAWSQVQSSLFGGNWLPFLKQII